MTIGGLNDELHHNQNRKMHFIPLKQGDQYYVELNNIFVIPVKLTLLISHCVYKGGEHESNVH